MRNHRDNYYPILRRLRLERERLAQIDAKKFRAQAIFGDKILTPFEKLDRAFSKLLVSAQELYQENLWEPDVTEEQRNRRIELRRIVWRHSDDDDVGKLLKSAVDEIEGILRPYIQHAAG